MRALLLASLVLLPLVAGVALAQVPGRTTASVSVAVDDPGHAMRPGKNETLDVSVNYNVQPGAVPVPRPDPNDPTSNVQPTRVTFAMKKLPTWVVNVTFEPAELMLAPDPKGGNAGGHTVATLVIDARATALDKQEFVVIAKADANGAIPEASGESPPINLKPVFVGKANLTAPAEMPVRGGRWTDLPFTLKNLGNAEARMKLNVTARPQNSQVEYPPSVVVARDGQMVVNVRVRVPWTGAEQGAVELEALPLTEDDSAKPVRADIEVLGQSAIGAPGALAALAVALGVAHARRRHP